MSSVPNCKDTKIKDRAPGPGSYIKDAHKKNNSDANIQNFQSTTKREGFWDNNISAPYTKPTFVKEVPGPGKYNHEKNKDDLRAKIVEEVSIPFSASGERDCLKKLNKTQQPGPG
jgi:hypothetical protein